MGNFSLEFFDRVILTFFSQFDVDGDIEALESGTLARINVSGRQLRPNDCKILTSILHRPAVASRLAILDLRCCIHHDNAGEAGLYGFGRSIPH